LLTWFDHGEQKANIRAYVQKELPEGEVEPLVEQCLQQMSTTRRAWN
jgi:hypothetical protein